MIYDWQDILYDIAKANAQMRYLEEKAKYDWAELGTINGVMYRGSAEKQALINRFLLGPAQDQPAQAAPPGEDPAVELQRSFFEIPGFVKTP